MESKRIKDASLEELENFTEIMEPIIDLLRNSWDIDVKPKGYDEYLKSNDSSYVPEEIEFKGLINTSSCNPPLPYLLSKPNVAYADKEQGRDPLTELTGALVGYGMAIGERRAKLEMIDGYFLEAVRSILEQMQSAKGMSRKRQKLKSDTLMAMMEIKFPHIFKENEEL